MLSSKDRQIARNTFFLYGRMLLSVWISLYTMRVILEKLGEDNYGIFNLVGGIVAFFAVLNGPMSAASSRFINIELGRGNLKSLARTFSTSVSIHVTMAVIIFVLAETVGLWFINTHLTIAPDRMAAANWTYQFSILAALVTVVQIPYSATIMAHEKMDAYALITLANVILKLVVVLALAFFATLDRLIVYAVLLFVATLLIGLAYAVYSWKYFPECRIWLRPRKAIFKEMLSFSGLDLYGNLAFVGRAQGANVILNNFGGTVLNAAGGIANTVSMAIYGFAGTIMNAFRPQIIQNYARSDFKNTLRLLDNSAKFSSLLMMMLITPCFVEVHYILAIWLPDVPAFTAVFCRLCMIAALGELLNCNVAIGIHATGKIFRISFISGSMYLLELPLMYWLLHTTGIVWMVYAVHMVGVFVILYVNTLILKRQMPEFSIWNFWKCGVLIPGVIFVPVLLSVWYVASLTSQSFVRLLSSCLLGCVLFCTLSYWIALDKDSRAMSHGYVMGKIKKLIRRG